MSKERDDLRWTDDAAVLRYVQDELLENDRQFMLLRWDTHPGLPVAEVFSGMERQAVELARHQNPKPLQDLTRPDHPMNKHGVGGKRIRDELSDEAWRLLQTPRKGGKPKMTQEQRRASNPVHDAVALVPVIEDILRGAFPGQTGIRVKACDVAARLLGLKDDRDKRGKPRSAGERVYQNVNRSLKDRARL